MGRLLQLNIFWALLYCPDSCSENRYLLFLTENYAALDILKHYLSGVDSTQTHNTADVKQGSIEPFVLFGSSFPKDQEYTQVGICLSRH